MKIRVANLDDVDTIIEIDRERFGEYDTTKENVIKKMKEFPGCAVLGLDNDRCIGFFIFEILDKSKIPEDFTEFKMKEQINGKWLHAVMFTPRGDYKNHKADSELLLFAENIARSKGCIESVVPLNKYHPSIKNKVFEFWARNGYIKDGETAWIVNENEKVDCWIYRKVL